MDTRKVLIVDDHPLMRTALQITVEESADLKVVGQAGSLLEARQLAEELQPDLLMLDLYLPDGNGLEMIHFRNEHLPTMRILVVTSSKAETDLMAALQAGADSYIMKDSTPEQLLKAVGNVLSGENFLSPGATVILLKQMRQPTAEAKKSFGPALSAREEEILRYLASGASNSDIAATLHISESTLRTHLQHILTKLGLQNRTQAVVYAINNP
jgi:DNA-binding NarL/FixJ family response regulator